jgi:hypothetical protein
MLSYQRIAAPQAGHADPGWTIDHRRGTRKMTTFRNDPTTAPTAKA